MEPIQSQETDVNLLSFHRTPSLRRKWRKRYGGLAGNNLLEPNKEEDMQDLPSFVINGTNTPVPHREQRKARAPQPWHTIGRPEAQYSLVKRKTAADALFDSFASNGRVNTQQFLKMLWSSGIRPADPRIKDCCTLMRKLQDTDETVDKNAFHRCVTGFVSFILKALQGRFVIPDFSTFAEETQRLYRKCKQLSCVPEKDSVRADDGKWAVSICTVDGQRLSLGDCTEPCVLGEISWPFIYCLSLGQLGVDYVHRYVGMEEYSKYESAFALTKQGLPHCPLTETGALVSASLLQQLTARPFTDEEEKYESILNVIRRLCNKEHANLNCTSYMNLRKDSAQLHALAFYLQEKKCFPESADMSASLDLLMQCFSTEVTCESGAVIAASLANGGLCPLSSDQVLSSSATRSTLSIMQVSGMNDYSRTFHFKTSAPAKSSRSGGVMVVIPGVLGLMCWSPELDGNGNPWKGVHFCEELVSTFQLHSFDIRTPFKQVLSYRQWKVESEGYQIMNLLLAAYRGDVQSLRRYVLSGVDVNSVDYDGRSALHVAASEGQLDVIRFLVENTGADCSLKDRWSNTPILEAMRCSQESALQLLKKYAEHEESF
ncbi:glutaminase kidney isoform, mitochondrial [Chanos chanos]|uniref:glutaminase n=1 Tax=Chanos chanos TaxID=29144 RepID=A0A6J2UPY2_CHACN|nr:glutaminase kidney isoform, mitochondrial-like [Chanos chanos]